MSRPKYYQDKAGRWRKSNGSFARKDLAERWFARYGKPKKKPAKKKRSEAAKKAAKTRARKKAEKEALKKKRSEAAKKAAATRKRRAQEKEALRKKRSEAAKKAAATRKRRAEERKKKEKEKKEAKKPLSPKEVETLEVEKEKLVGVYPPPQEPGITKEKKRISKEARKKALEIEEWLRQFNPNASVVINKDGTIDGEARMGIPVEGMAKLEDLLAGAPEGTWIQTGGVFEVEGDWKELTEKYKTYPNAVVLAHPQRGNLAIENAATAMEIAENMEEHGHIDMYTMIRLSWQPGGERPERKY